MDLYFQFFDNPFFSFKRVDIYLVSSLNIDSPPNWWELFKAHYYENTFLPPTTLEDAALRSYLPEDYAILERVQKLISSPAVHAALTKPPTYTSSFRHDFEIMRDDNTRLQHAGFTLLGGPNILRDHERLILPFHSVVSHFELPGWVIKCGASQPLSDGLNFIPPNDNNEYSYWTGKEHIFRVLMSRHISKVIERQNIKGVVVPKHYLVPYGDQHNSDIMAKYCVICEELDVLSDTRTIEAIEDMEPNEQEILASKILKIVTTAGLADASFHTIRLTNERIRKKEVALISAKPAGLIVAKNSPIQGSSIEKSGRVGAYRFIMAAEQALRREEGNNALLPFCRQLNRDYVKISKPKFSRWKIALSVFIIIPLINAIIALIKLKLIKRVLEKLQTIKNGRNAILERSKKSEDSLLLRKYRAEEQLLFTQLFNYLNGVPFKRSASIAS